MLIMVLKEKNNSTEAKRSVLFLLEFSVAVRVL